MVSAGHSKRRLRDKVGTLHKDSLHPAAPLLRSLRIVENTDLLQEGFSFPKCPVNVEVEDICARVLNVQFSFEKIAEAVDPIVGKFVNGENGYLDVIVKPFEKIREPLPGISQVAGRDITVIDIAEVFVGKEKSGSDTVRTIFKIYDNIGGFADQISSGEIILAEVCDVIQNFNCTGGLSGRGGEEDEDLTEEQRRLQSKCSDQYTDKLGCVGNCELCGSVSSFQLADCRRRQIGCQAGDIKGLSFPWMSQPLKLLDLLKGEDIVSPQRFTFKFMWLLLLTLFLVRNWSSLNHPKSRLPFPSRSRLSFTLHHLLNWKLALNSVHQ